MKTIDNLLARLEGLEQLDPISAVMSSGAAKLGDTTVDVLSGTWLGHPLHPALSDLPIGFWTSSFVLDLAVGGDAEQRRSDFSPSESCR